MPLTLVLDGGPGGAGRETRTLSQGTLSIGRAPGNDWVLADPDRQLSKTHCVIVAAGGRYMLTDLSTNGVYVNGATERVPREGQIELTDGDDFRIGEYVIRLSEGAGQAAPFGGGHAALVQGGVARADPLAGPEDLTPDPLDDVFGAGAAGAFVHPISAPQPQVMRHNDPFDVADEKVPPKRGIDPEDDDLFQGITPSVQWEGPSQADHADAPMQAYTAPKVAPANFDDLDLDALLGDTPPGQAAPAASPMPAGRAAPARPVARQDPLGEAAPFDFGVETPAQAPSRMPSQAPSPMGEPFDFENEPPPAPPVARRGAGGAAPPGAPAGDMASPFDEPGFAAPGGASAGALQRPLPAGPLPGGPSSGAVGQAAAIGAPTADGARLLAAFLEGAGVPGLALGPDAERAMRDAGAVFNALVEGIRQVLISRASIKNELRVEQTMLRAKDNNPLKFSVTAEDAIAALLQPTRPGYKQPLASTQEAFDDVRSHEMAVMAGVQTALMGLLKRFEPGALEKRLEPSMLGNILPSARKARTWELFCATYKAIAAEAQEDFQAVFGREFARAYSEQMQKL
jgi:type VI secretion system protein